MSGDSSKICRACLRLGNCKFYELKENRRYFTDLLKVEMDELLVYWLCYTCHYRIDKFLTFTDKVLLANAVFSHEFNKRYLMNKELMQTTHTAIGFPKLQWRNQRYEDASTFQFYHEEFDLQRNVKLELLEEDIEYMTDSKQDDDFECSVDNSHVTDSCDDRRTDELDVAEKRRLQLQKMKDNAGKMVVIRMNPAEQVEEFQSRRTNKSYLEANFKCEFCILGFRYQDSYVGHLEKHTEEYGRHECDMCHQRFPNLPRIKMHLGTHTTRYKCVLCDYKKVCRCTVVDHYNIHHGKKTSYGDHGNIHQSMRIQTSQIKIEVPEKKAKKPPEIKAPGEDENITSVRLNGKEVIELFKKRALQKPYLDAIFKCDKCYTGCNYSDSYNLHMKKHCKSSGNFECDICHIFLETDRKRRSHKLYHHNRMYKCTICNYMRSDRRVIQIHYRANHSDNCSE